VMLAGERKKGRMAFERHNECECGFELGCKKLRPGKNRRYFPGWDKSIIFVAAIERNGGFQTELG